MAELDKVLVNKIKGLKLEYKDEPQPELLIRIPNRNTDIPRMVTHTTNEFTSLCPLHISQPDYARITIAFQPVDYLVELKSLKFYLVSFRNCQIFHEDVIPTILKALLEVLGEVSIMVTGEFSTRGGLSTVVQCEHVAGVVVNED